MNDWNGIERFYAIHRDLICNSPPDEWAIGAYSWDGLLRMTPIEAWLWEDIRDANVVMYPQWPVAGVFLDFANPAAMVAIECDGMEWHLDKAKDEARDLKLQALGWTIYRIPGYLCATQSDEETGNASRARQFIEDICERHPVKRHGRDRGWVKLGQESEFA